MIKILKFINSYQHTHLAIPHILIYYYFFLSQINFYYNSLTKIMNINVEPINFINKF